MSGQLNLWFDGETYDHERDSQRLGGQLEDVFNLVKDGKWRTLKEISQQSGHPESSISARLRDLRKVRFGSHVVEKEYINNGLYKYRVVVEETML
jgi:hypothetical protein